ncbi:MAG: hypothetical protein ABR499_05330 [Gemmatimonadaceae bacterium]
MSTDDSLNEALVRVRSLLIDLERHVDRGSAENDLTEVGRAWVRAAQVERLLRSVLPADVAADPADVPEREQDAEAHPAAADGEGSTRPPS